MTKQLIQLWQTAIEQLGPVGAVIALAMLIALVAMVVVIPVALAGLSRLGLEDDTPRPVTPRPERLQRLVDARVRREADRQVAKLADPDRRRA